MTITAQQAIPKHCEPDLAPVCATNAAGQTGSFMNLCIWEQVALAYRWGNYIDNIHSNCDCDMCRIQLQAIFNSINIQMRANTQTARVMVNLTKNNALCGT